MDVLWLASYIKVTASLIIDLTSIKLVQFVNSLETPQVKRVKTLSP